MKPKYRYALLITCCIFLFFISWKLWNLPLWGHWPLGFHLCLWSCVLLLIFPKVWSSGKRLKYLFLSTLSGTLLFWGFPSFGITPLLFVAFIPLLWLEDLIGKNHPNPGRTVFFYAYHAFAVWNIVSTFWVTNTAFIAGIVAIFLNSFFMAAVFWGYHQVKKKISTSMQVVAFSGFWISFEWLHLHWEIAWPWLNLGNAFSATHSWIQWYEYTGALGGTLWVLLINFLIFKTIILKKRQRNWQAWMPPMLCILIPIVISLWRYSSYQNQGSPVNIAVVQPNFEPHYEKFNIPGQQQVTRFINLSRNCINHNTQYLLFPETSFGHFNSDRLIYQPVIDSLIRFTQNYPDLNLITGLSTAHYYTPRNKPDKDLRSYNINGDTIFIQPENSAIQISNGQLSPLYYKSIFVPGAEIFPYKRFLPFLQPIVQKLGGSMSDWGSQNERSTFNDDHLKVGPIICYESVFGEYVSGYVRQGANLLFIATNDGWWDNTMGHKQHVQFARLRAIEQRKSIARSANMGISGVINQKGDLKAANKYGEMICQSYTIHANNTITFYARWGDFIARIALFSAGLMILSSLIRHFRSITSV